MLSKRSGCEGSMTPGRLPDIDRGIRVWDGPAASVMVTSTRF